MKTPSFRIAWSLSLAVLGACGPGPAAPPRAGREEPKIVRTARVEASAKEWTEVPGSVEAVRAAAISSRLAALVEELKADEGSRVRAGEVLVKLDGRDVRARIEAARAGAAAARAQRDRLRRLLEKNAATRAEVEAADAADAAADGERAAAEAQLEYVSLRAPFDGLVVKRNVQAGDLARPGVPLLELQGISGLRVQATLSAGQADGIRVGDVVEAILEGDVAASARVSILGPAGEPETRRVLVKADLPEGTRARPGAFARLRLARDAAAPVALVPASALFERGALTGVYVVEEGRARLRWISPGEREGAAVAVRAGLEPGEEVIVDPPPLEDGTAVTGGRQAP